MTAIASLSVTAEISHSVGNGLCLIFLTVVIHLLSCIWLCDLMHCSLPGFSVLHYLWGCSNSCPLSHGCYLTISSSAGPFSYRPQSYRAFGSFPISWLFTSGGQNIGASASASVLPKNIQDWFPLGWTGCISLQFKESSPTPQFKTITSSLLRFL